MGGGGGGGHSGPSAAELEQRRRNEEKQRLLEEKQAIQDQKNKLREKGQLAYAQGRQEAGARAMGLDEQAIKRRSLLGGAAGTGG